MMLRLYVLLLSLRDGADDQVTADTSLRGMSPLEA